MNTETLEQLLSSKLAVEAESRNIGAQQARSLMEYSPDYDLLSMLFDSAKSWAKHDDNYEEGLNYIDLNGTSAAVNGGIVDGFFSEIIDMHSQLMAAVQS